MMRIVPLVIAAMCYASAAYAQIKMTGTFDVTKDCPAVVSIRKGTNPDNASVRAGDTHVLMGKNKAAETHYLVEVPDAVPPQRWVARECGKVVSDEAPAQETKAAPPADQSFYILAVSWQPAFCEGLPNKPECKSQTADRYDAKNFTLHGLWPQPRSNVFCGVSAKDKAASEDRRWQELPEVKLSPSTRATLDKVMPGTQSALERHEWIKHGTCYSQSMETYYADSVRLMEELNATKATSFLAANIGKVVKASDVRRALDESLGAGAADRMRFSCKSDGNRQLLVEITIGLKGAPANAGLKDLIMASAPTDPGCPEFFVDPVGLQ
jgi:ribonuclease T2